jgi:hypothetical protein
MAPLAQSANPTHARRSSSSAKSAPPHTQELEAGFINNGRSWAICKCTAVTTLCEGTQSGINSSGAEIARCPFVTQCLAPRNQKRKTSSRYKWRVHSRGEGRHISRLAGHTARTPLQSSAEPLAQLKSLCSDTIICPCDCTHGAEFPARQLARQILATQNLC